MYGTTFDPGSEINRNPSSSKDPALNRYLRLLNTQSTDDLLYGHHLIDRERQLLGLDLQVPDENFRRDQMSETMGLSGAMDHNRQLRDSLHSSIGQPPLDLSISVQQRSGVYFDDDFQAAGIVDSTHTSEFSLSDSYVSQSTLDTVLKSVTLPSPFLVSESQHQTQTVLERLASDASTPEVVRARYRLAFPSECTPTNSPFRRTFKQSWDPEAIAKPNANASAAATSVLTHSTVENRETNSNSTTSSWRRVGGGVTRTQSTKSSREEVLTSPIQRTTWKQVASARSPETSQLSTAALPETETPETETPKQRLTSFKQVARSRQNSRDDLVASVHQTSNTPKSVNTAETQTVLTMPTSNQSSFAAAALTLPRGASAAATATPLQLSSVPLIRQNLKLPAPTASRPLPTLKFLKQSRRANSYSRITKRFHSVGSGLDLQSNTGSTSTSIPDQDAMVKSAQSQSAAAGGKPASVTWATLTLPRSRQNNLNANANVLSPTHKHKPRPVIKQNSSNSSSPSASHLQASQQSDSSSGVSSAPLPLPRAQPSAPAAIGQLAAADPQDSLVLLTQSSTTAAESEKLGNRQRPHAECRGDADGDGQDAETGAPPPRKSVSFSEFVRTQTLSPVHRSAHAGSGSGNGNGEDGSPHASRSRSNARQSQRTAAVARSSNSISDLVRLQIELPPSCFATQSLTQTLTHPPARNSSAAPATPAPRQHPPDMQQKQPPRPPTPVGGDESRAKRAGSLEYVAAVAGEASRQPTQRPAFVKSRSPSADPSNGNQTRLHSSLMRTQTSIGGAGGDADARHRGLVLDLQLALDLLLKHVELFSATNSPDEQTEDDAEHEAAMTRKLVRILMDYLAPALIGLLADGLDVLQSPAPRHTPLLTETVWRTLGQLLFACFPSSARPPLLRAYNQQQMPAANNSNNNPSLSASELEPRARLLCFLAALLNAGRLDSFLRALLSELELDALSKIYPESACVVQCNRAFREAALSDWLVSLEQRLHSPLAPLPIAAADLEAVLSASSASAVSPLTSRVPHSQTVGEHLVALSTGSRATVLSVRQVKALKASRSNRELSGVASSSFEMLESGLASSGGGRAASAQTAALGSSRAIPGPMPMRARHDIDPIRAPATATPPSAPTNPQQTATGASSSGRTVLHRLIEKFV